MYLLVQFYCSGMVYAIAGISHSKCDSLSLEVMIGGMDMFCSNCGTKVENGAKFCPECGNPLGGGSNAGAQVASNTVATNNVTGSAALQETVLAKNKVGLSRNGSLLGDAGTAMVTNKRIVFKKISKAKLLLIGPAAFLMDGNYDFEIAYSDIAELSVGKLGFNKSVNVTTKDGNLYQFTSQLGPLSDFAKEWYDIIRPLCSF